MSQKELLLKIVSNIVKNPAEPKYKRINRSVLPPGTREELKKLGFVQKDAHLLFESSDLSSLQLFLTQLNTPPARLTREAIAQLTEARLKNPPPVLAPALVRPAPAAKPTPVSRQRGVVSLEDLTKKALGPTPFADEYLQRRATSRLDFEYLGRLCVDLTNKFRASERLSVLSWSPEIHDVAQRHAEAVARGNEPFSHQNFNRRFDEIRLTFKVGGAENLAMTSDQAESAVDGWIDSPGHKANLVGDFNFCAVGVARDHGVYFLTQLFVRR